MNYWYVESIVEKSSKLMPHATTYHITLRSCESGERRITYVEDRFKNYANWREVIQRYPQGQIISNCVTMGQDKINADSKPVIEFVLDAQEMAQIMEEKWQHIQATKRS